MMAPAILAVKGFAAPETVLNFQRARELGLRLVRVEEMYQLLFHLATMHELRGKYGLAEQILEERLRLPRANDGAAVQIDSDTLLALRKGRVVRPELVLRAANRRCAQW